MLSVRQGRSQGMPAFLTPGILPQVKELAEALQVTPHLFPGAHDMMLVSTALAGSISCLGNKHLSTCSYSSRH